VGERNGERRRGRYDRAMCETAIAGKKRAAAAGKTNASLTSRRRTSIYTRKESTIGEKVGAKRGEHGC